MMMGLWCGFIGFMLDSDGGFGFKHFLIREGTNVACFP